DDAATRRPLRFRRDIQLLGGSELQKNSQITELKITNYELRITNYELRIKNYELRITDYELKEAK
ncbi:MAG: hypothetical protein LBC19_15520, partial [Tannerella sp.]|nr:hypothetical protein [Tannerella sp.]